MIECDTIESVLANGGGLPTSRFALGFRVGTKLVQAPLN
jgi:hypothetical protein